MNRKLGLITGGVLLLALLSMGQVRVTRAVNRVVGGLITTTGQFASETTATWNNASASLRAVRIAVTDTDSAATSRLFEILGGTNGTTDRMYVLKGGDVISASSFQGPVFAGTNYIRLAGNGASTGVALSWAKFSRSLSGIADNTGTHLLTITVPNAAHAAVVKVMLMGSLGAGGAVGVHEATGMAEYHIAVTRTPGLASVATASLMTGSNPTAAVAGAATITVTGALVGPTGANNVQQTWSFQVTINSGTGTSANHICVTAVEVINYVASGVTVGA